MRSEAMAGNRISRAILQQLTRLASEGGAKAA